jgi:uncharacterized protein YkwD
MSVVALTLLSAPTAASAIDAPERKALELVNGTRAGHDLRRVVVRSRLMRYAERHTRAMARRSALFHSTLSIDGYSALGECVGYGRRVRSVFRAFMGSSTHRRIILGRWKYVGIGVVSRGGRKYVTLDFAR